MTVSGTLGLLANIKAPLIAVRLDDGIILSANKPFLELFDYAIDELVGASVELLSPENPSMPRMGMPLLKLSGNVSTVSAQTKAGWPLRLDVSVWHFHDSARVPIAAVAIDAKGLPGRLLDVIASRHSALLSAHDALRSAHNKLRLRHDELEAQRHAQGAMRQTLLRLARRSSAEDMMQRLVSTLQGPLAVALTHLHSAGLAFETSLDADAPGLVDVQRARNAVETARSLLEQMQLEQSKTHNLGANTARVSAELHQAVDLLSADRPDPLQIDTDVEEPLFVACQAADLHLALTNVIAHALDLVGSGRVRVLARSHGAVVEIGVYGEPEDLARQQAMQGLGLDLARDALARCGGSLLDSDVDAHGALYRLRLPQVAGEAQL